VIYSQTRGWLPRGLRDYVLHFEAAIEDAVDKFASSLPAGARVLDAGAGEGNYRGAFAAQRYVGLDLAVGDSAWDYSKLDVLGDLTALPFRDGVFDASLNVVTLEHVQEPARVLAELYRTLSPAARLLLIVPHEWEEHQQPHDYFRYTRYGIEYLLRQAGFREFEIRPVGGFFRLLSRRLLNALQFFPGPLMFLAAIFFVPPALLLPMLEPLDRRQNFTLGYICHARKAS
jgi:SAM-dependent methyltransferase